MILLYQISINDPTHIIVDIYSYSLSTYTRTILIRLSQANTPILWFVQYL